MKKLIVTIAFFMLMCFAPVAAYASPLSEATPAVQEELKELDFSVSSGIKSFDKTESTFDEARTISGTAEQGAAIAIGVYTKNASGELSEDAMYSIEVGATGLFSQSLSLKVGENVVKITASKDGCEPVCQEAVIKRKNREIKTELETGVSIPGNGSYSTRPLFMGDGNM